jgi:hypothetical protein
MVIMSKKHDFPELEKDSTNYVNYFKNIINT